MSLHHKILSAAFYPIKLAKAIGRPLGLTNANQLRVLLYHDIDPRDQEAFARQMRWLQSSWNFVSPERFAAMISGQEPICGRNLLLTFDDGFVSNRVVAEKVLNPLGIKALFFVVSHFVELEDKDEARHFIAQNMYFGPSANKMPAHWCNMGWSDLEALLQQGHCIGGHTSTHALLSKIKTDSTLEREIIASADILEQRLGVPIEHFAFTWGDMASYSEQALAIARQRYRFIYSGMRGDNSRVVAPHAISRDSAAFQDKCYNYSVFSNNLLGAFLEGAADFKYAKDVRLLSSWDKKFKT